LAKHGNAIASGQIIKSLALVGCHIPFSRVTETMGSEFSHAASDTGDQNLDRYAEAPW
jgi:hypothetical protein